MIMIAVAEQFFMIIWKGKGMGFSIKEGIYKFKIEDLKKGIYFVEVKTLKNKKRFKVVKF